MREVVVVKKNRDKLREVSETIWQEMKRVKNGRLISEMEREETTYYFHLSSLRMHYIALANALNFVLNEDNNLNTMEDSKLYDDCKGFFFKQES